MMRIFGFALFFMAIWGCIVGNVTATIPFFIAGTILMYK